jgi:hypothetical protein
MFKAIGREYDWPAPRDFPTAIKATVAEGYAGIYQSQSGTRFRVACGTDSLILYAGQQPPRPLAPASETEFLRQPQISMCNSSVRLMVQSFA